MKRTEPACCSKWRYARRKYPSGQPHSGPYEIVSVNGYPRGDVYVVVVEPFRDASIVRVVGVVIVTTILIIMRVQRFHAERPAKELVGDPESTAGVLRVK